MALRAASKQVADVVAAQTALATGEVDIVVGGGEWLTAVLAAENPNLDWTIPKQGACAGRSRSAWWPGPPSPIWRWSS
jgi:spermidine/putrescine transport system substrate-binding protein